MFVKLREVGVSEENAIMIIKECVQANNGVIRVDGIAPGVGPSSSFAGIQAAHVVDNGGSATSALANAYGASIFGGGR